MQNVALSMQNVEKMIDSIWNVAYNTVNLQNVERRIGMLTVKQWRLVKGFSQEDMATKCGVHRNTYASWEENPDNISIKNARIIADALGEPINEIFFINISTKRRKE